MDDLLKNKNKTKSSIKTKKSHPHHIDITVIHVAVMASALSKKVKKQFESIYHLELKSQKIDGKELTSFSAEIIPKQESGAWNMFLAFKLLITDVYEIAALLSFHFEKSANAVKYVNTIDYTIKSEIA
jgi:hypothetical protein